MTDSDRVPVPEAGPQYRNGQPGQAPSPRQPEQADAKEIAEAVVDRIGDKVSDNRGQQADIPSVSQAIALREQAPEMYDLWLKIAKDKAATANYVERAPYEVPERLAQSGRPRALGALVIVLSFCGYLAWLGGPGPYIAGLIAVLDLAVMFGMFFGLRPERLPDPQQPERRPSQRRRSLGRQELLKPELPYPLLMRPRHSVRRFKPVCARQDRCMKCLPGSPGQPGPTGLGWAAGHAKLPESVRSWAARPGQPRAAG